MIIENLDALKSWLSKTLEPICDADPSALAKYVVALVKKDKTEKELKALCIDQLDTFVDRLFEAVNSKSYLPQFEQPSSAGRTEIHQRQDKDDPKKDEPNKEDEREKKFSRRVNHSPPHQSRTRSREKDAGKSKYEHERPERCEPSDSYTPAPLVAGVGVASSHFPVPTLSSTITVIAPTHHGNSTTESWSEFHENHQLEHGSYGRGPPQRKRCRDYDEKGFCMRGDMCPFDHGSDPVVVEDVNLPSILPFQGQPLPVVDAPPPPGLPPPPPLMTPPPVNLRPPVPPPGTLPPSLPPVAGRPPPPLPPLQPSGMDAPPNSITSSVPTIVTSGPDVYNPETPSITSTSRPVYRHRVHAQRPNLIGLTMGEVDLPPREKNMSNNSMRIVVESDPRKRPGGSIDGGGPPKKPWFDKHGFNKPNHQGFQKKMPCLSTKLDVRQIPAELNNISKLNEHFSKFGTIVNLQVAYQNDPEGALIQFSTHEEAKRAILSTEAVLNNRFIRVYWHRQDVQPHPPSQMGAQSAPQPPVATLKQSVKDRLGPIPTSDAEPPQDPSLAPQTAAKMSVKDRLGFSSKPAVPGGKVFSTSTGLTKTVYNPAALKAAQKSVAFPNPAFSEEALKKKQEALKLQQDVRKKKQEILEKHIETQKLLISKLEKNKSMKPEDKAQIMETSTTLTKNIIKLQAEIKAISSGNTQKVVKSKAQAQKELLDTELDLYKKMQAGEDIAQLRIKYTQLQLEGAVGVATPGAVEPSAAGAGACEGVAGEPQSTLLWTTDHERSTSQGSRSQTEWTFSHTSHNLGKLKIARLMTLPTPRSSPLARERRQSCATPHSDGSACLSAPSIPCHI
ncbi:hypothetical protein JZ751_027259 [Albula glossodonta]|uniref:RNA binding motif protein 26 n=1 Tax=Albula glossodonta TaxID=121402 RepID=A0A8T2NFD5_9TELE|nr:hypothetical protein JZ751_027259 [Albula glossodonta]